MLHQHYEERHQEAVAFVKENKHLIDDYFSKADTITINYDKVDISPMGGSVDVEGYINHNPELHFSLGIDEDYRTAEIDSVIYVPEVEKYIDRTN